jgi:hypothetical protein
MDRSFIHFKIGLIALTLGVGIAAKVAPELRKFDLVCRLHSRFVRELHPTNKDIWAMPTDSWRGTERFSVDLDGMKIRDIGATEKCVKSVCNFIENSKDLHINRLNKDYILVSTHPFRKWNIRRIDGWFESHYVVSPYKTQLTTGTCRRAPFSGFPVLPRTVGNK